MVNFCKGSNVETSTTLGLLVELSYDFTNVIENGINAADTMHCL